MKFTVETKVTLKTKQVQKLMDEATRLGLRDVIVIMAEDAIEHSAVKTGNNRRGIFFGVTGFGHHQASPQGRAPGDTWTGEDRSLLNETKTEGAIYSTSGYGGYLETGTSKMDAQPYIVPAFERHKDKLVPAIKEHLK